MRRPGGHVGLSREAAADLARRVVPLLLALLGLPSACGRPLPVATPSPPPAAAVSYVHLGDRGARVFDPPGARALVIALHGSGGSAEEFARATGFDAMAERDRFRAVYPEGTGHTWNAGFCCPFGNPPRVDDVAFLGSVIEAEARPGWRVFVLGFSNGGMMAYRLACAIPARITAIGVVGSDSEECSPRPPLPAILHLQGTADDLTGNRVWGLRGGQWVNTEPSATARWRRLGADVTLVSVPGGRHTWYRSDPDASREIAGFFAARAA